MRGLLVAAILSLGLSLSGARAVETTIMTGKPTGTYIRFGTTWPASPSISAICAVVSSAGSPTTSRRSSATQNTHLDRLINVLDFVATFSDDPGLRTTAKSLRMVFPLYNEEVHLVARQGVDLADLKDKRVAIGAPNSGTLLTSNLMLATAGIEPAEEVEIDPDEALPALRDGQIDAFFYVAGRPVRLFAQDVVEADGLHLVRSPTRGCCPSTDAPSFPPAPIAGRRRRCRRSPCAPSS